MSSHKIEVVEVIPEPHPNADRLEVVKVYDFTCCVEKGLWKAGELAAYILPDSVVPDRPEYAFLAGKRRIKVKKLRGIVSMGLLMKAPEGSKKGDDVAEIMGIEHYEPLMEVTQGDQESAPSGYFPVYDVENFFRHADLFQEGEEVYVSEKLHGASSRFTFSEGRMRAGSRTTWKKQDPNNLWWRILAKYPQIAKFCEENPDCTLYGETFGRVQTLHYGAKQGEHFFAAFDILRGSSFLGVDEFEAIITKYQIPITPKIGRMPFNKEALVKLSNGPSLYPGADHMREGIVVRPIIERTVPEIGRVHLKIVGSDFLEKH